MDEAGRTSDRVGIDDLVAKRAFIAAFSHELRTPLNAVICFLQLLELEEPAVQIDRQELQVAIRNAWRLSQAVDQVIQSLATGPCWRTEHDRNSRCTADTLLHICGPARCAERGGR